MARLAERLYLKKSVYGIRQRQEKKVFDIWYLVRENNRNERISIFD
jgi:hypothetical protein